LNEDGSERTFWLDGDGTINANLEERNLPFVPHPTGCFTDKETGRRYGSYTFSCPELTSEGRCAVYRQRPEVCRKFEPAGGSRLCVHSGGAEGTGDGL
jgi:Fe-S-cluster containining protein